MAELSSEAAGLHIGDRGASTSTGTGASATWRDRLLQWVLPSASDIFFVAALIGALASGAQMISSDGDLARHLTVGEQILQTGRILTQDVFAYTRGCQP